MSDLSSGSVAERYRSLISSAVILSCLGLIGWWGHATHWQIPGMGKHQDHDAHAAPPPPTPPTNADPSKLSLADGEVVTESEINVEKSRQEKIERCVIANGIVDFNQTKVAQLSVKVPGAIWRVEKQVGAFVNKGDVLAIIDSMEVGKAKAAFLSAIAEVQIRKQILTKLRSIDGVVPERQIREAEVLLRKVQIDLYNARESLVNLGLPVQVDEVIDLPTDELTRFVHFLGLPTEISEQLDPRRTTANLIPVVAPFAGVVSGRDAVIGEIVSPSNPVFTVVDLSQMWVQLDVRLEDADMVRVGQGVDFKPDDQEDSVSGIVNWIDTQVDPKTRTLKVRVDVKNPATENGNGLVETRLLRAHSFGTGKISVASAENAVVISKHCIQWDHDQPTVFVQTSPTEFVRRPILVGIDAGRDIEVVQGLAVGDAIVNVGSRLLHSESHNRRMKMAQ